MSNPSNPTVIPTVPYHPENYSMERRKNDVIVFSSYEKCEDPECKNEHTMSRKHDGQFCAKYKDVRVVCLQPLGKGDYRAVVQHECEERVWWEIILLDKSKAYSGSGKKHPPFNLDAFVSMYLSRWVHAVVLTENLCGDIGWCLLSSKKFDKLALEVKDDLPVSVARVIPKK